MRLPDGDGVTDDGPHSPTTPWTVRLDYKPVSVTRYQPMERKY